ncbi:MAG: 4Fe-4S dicluster domain-containing protein [Actinobacteria bacterium]|nr:4Fe-4S dicluster domain-containing protein [Actinomycetota bacterium]
MLNTDLLDRTKDILKNKLDELDLIIGYQKGVNPISNSPLFIRKADDVERFEYGFFSSQSLPQYLTYYKGKIGLVVKGCDSRAINQLIVEERVRREDLFVLAMPCLGTIHPKKVERKLNGLPIRAARVEGSTLIINSYDEDKDIEVPLEEAVFDKCLSCSYHEPATMDEAAGDFEKPPIATKDGYFDVLELQSKSSDELFDFWRTEFERCIRCYACRNACPMCYCQFNCLANTRDPKWLSERTTFQENAMFHMIRATHLIGRCTGCQECERVCPMNIPISLLFRKNDEIVERLFGYVAGKNIDEQPPLLTFKKTEENIP